MVCKTAEQALKRKDVKDLIMVLYGIKWFQDLHLLMDQITISSKTNKKLFDKAVTL